LLNGCRGAQVLQEGKRTLPKEGKIGRSRRGEKGKRTFLVLSKKKCSWAINLRKRGRKEKVISIGPPLA